MAPESPQDPMVARFGHLQDLLGEGRMDPAAGYALLQIQGPDAAEYLHRMCSQEVDGMAVGGAAPAAFLDPKGKLMAVVAVGRLAPDRFVLETQDHQQETVRELLDRYHFTERLELTARPGGCAELLEIGDAPATDGPWSVGEEVGGIAFRGARRGVRWHRVHGPDAVAGLGTGVDRIQPEEREAVRLLVGEPRIGVDTEARTLGMEAGIDDFLSTTKGCYTGQEIVARIHTYGQVNRRLCLLWIEGSGALAADTEVVEPEDDIPVGRIKSAVDLPAGGRLALAWLPKDFWALGSAVNVADAPAQVWGFGPPDATAA